MVLTRIFIKKAVLAAALASMTGCASLEWETVSAVGEPTARHEASLTSFDKRLYLIGGRRINPTNVFDPRTKRWSEKSPTPIELHHFQPVIVDDAIYLLGAMTGEWPNETPVDRVIIYYPKTDKYVFGHEIPEDRRRGGAGAVYHEGKIYLVGGITNGHMDGYVPWFDAYDPKTGEWTILEDAPNARDHFQAVVAGGKLYALAGRKTSYRTGQDMELTVAETDIYDFSQQRWLSTDKNLDIPTPRAGNFALHWKNKIYVGGGESANQIPAHSEVEILDIQSQKWEKGPSLIRGRHGTGFAEIDGHLYTASGCGNRGGEPELTSTERLELP